MKENKWTKNLFSKLLILIMIIIAIFAYKKYDYNFYSKGIAETGKTSFSRDSKNTVNKDSSYKIENKDYNDAMFYREIEVKQVTPYKVTCMVKTENVEQFENEQLAGAQIVLKNTEEHSKVLSGTNDWTKLEFYFNSKNNSKVEIGFRLGGNGQKAKGTAWISDITLEEGFQEKADITTWNFACFVFDNVDVTLDNGYNVKESLNLLDVYNITDTMQRFKETCDALSKNRMNVEFDVIEIKEPITTLTYDEANGYYIGEGDVYNLIQNYVEQKEYDHIFVCAKLPSEEIMADANKTNWIGLGNMQYCGKGYSNIRITEEDTGIYQFSNKNTFPEEVFLHEFLHTLERNSAEYGYEVPALHDYANYGYSESRTDGLRAWYKDYMNKEIKYNGKYIGLPEEIYAYSTIQPSNFVYSNKLNYLDAPHNLIEIVQSLGARIKLLFNKNNDETIKVQIISQ